MSIQLVTNNKYARQVRSCAAGFMTLSDYWAPGPPSPAFDITSVFSLSRVLYACFSGDGVHPLVYGYLLLLVSFFMSCMFILFAFQYCHAAVFPISHDAIVSIACY